MPRFNQKQTIIWFCWHMLWICYCMVRPREKPDGLRSVHTSESLDHSLIRYLPCRMIISLHYIWIEHRRIPWESTSRCAVSQAQLENVTRNRVRLSLSCRNWQGVPMSRTRLLKYTDAIRGKSGFWQSPFIPYLPWSSACFGSIIGNPDHRVYLSMCRFWNVGTVKPDIEVGICHGVYQKGLVSLSTTGRVVRTDSFGNCTRWNFTTDNNLVLKCVLTFPQEFHLW